MGPLTGFRILEIYQGASYAALAALSIVLTLIILAFSTLQIVLTARQD